jgi:hypothetical protein
MKRKIFILTISCLALLIVLFSCKKKNAVTDNNPPNKPFAPQVTIDTSEIGEKVTFTVTVFDPDEDSVAGRFNWGDGDTSDWCDFITNGDTVIGNHCYRSKGTFYIRAQAKDNHDGLSDWSEPDSVVIQDSAWTIVWTCASEAAPWSPRMFLTVSIFNDKIWVLGGYDSLHCCNDVWFSSDGVNWTCATESAQWRGSHTSFVFDNKIWIIGLGDVWYSNNGINWTCATDSAVWSPRSGYVSIIYDDKIWVFGGGDYPYYNDVWYSNDGINWTCVTNSAPWPGRALPTSVVFDNMLWLLGGGGGVAPDIYNDVWYSTDGIDWTCATDSAGWSDRDGHTSVVYDDKIWVMGGFAEDRSGFGPHNDVWYSIDGSDWYCLTNSAPWIKREYFASVVFDNKIWILGGVDGANRRNDVWYGEIVRGKR